VCATFEYDFIIIALILWFQAMLKWAGSTEVEGTDTAGGGHPEGVVVSEIAKVTSKVVMGLEGLRTAEVVANLPVEYTT
jgi:hypothetical protein